MSRHRIMGWAGTGEPSAATLLGLAPKPSFLVPGAEALGPNRRGRKVLPVPDAFLIMVAPPPANQRPSNLQMAVHWFAPPVKGISARAPVRIQQLAEPDVESPEL